MAVTIHCDWCNKSITKLPSGKVKSWLQANEEMCDECKKKVEQLDGFMEQRKDKFVKMVERSTKEHQNELQREIRRLAETNMPEEG